MKLRHVFVDSFPRPLEEGVVYVSVKYRSSAHLCLCGCGSEVVTPLRPDAWTLTFDGVSISLSPSIGSYNLACKSHYFITNGAVRWVPKWYDRDRPVTIEELDESEPIEATETAEVDTTPEEVPETPQRIAFWARVFRAVGLRG